MPSNALYTQKYLGFTGTVVSAPKTDTAYPTGFVNAPDLRDGTQPDHTTSYAQSGSLTQGVTLAAVWDLLSNVAVNTCKFSAKVQDPTGVTKNYELFYSTDGSTWTSAGSSTFADSAIHDVTIGSIGQSKRYWKLEIYAASDGVTQGIATLYDFRLYDNSSVEYTIAATVTSGQDCLGQGG